MFFGIIGMLILYVLLKYILAWIRYFNSQDERLGQSTWRWSYDYEVDGERDTVSYTHLTLPTTPYV